MKVKVARTGRLVSLSRPQQMFAQSRATVQEGFAGDVIGLTSAHLLLLLLVLAASVLMLLFSIPTCLAMYIQSEMPSASRSWHPMLAVSPAKAATVKAGKMK
jgi:hypothetical protein